MLQTCRQSIRRIIWVTTACLICITAVSIGPQVISAQDDVQFWTCSMHPNIRLPEPGLCPICSMELIPVTTGPEESIEGRRELTLTPYARKLAEIRTSPVERKFVTRQIRMVGRVEYDETRMSYITARVPGRIDRMYVNYTGIFVRKGRPMVSVYSPELLAAREELLQAIQTERKLGKSRIAVVRDTTAATAAAARKKLRLLGLTSGQIDDIIRQPGSSDHITLTAPGSGVVIRMDAREGIYVNTGSRIYTIADLSRVWVRLDAYESDLAWIRKGQTVTFETEARPGESFTGKVDFIDPFLNPKTRTVKVRVNASNPDGFLKPDMFVRASLKATLDATGKTVTEPTDKARPPLVIPAGAPLITGKRAVVYVAVPDRPGTFEGRVIVLGPRAGDYYHVMRGVEEGERVVTHGNFKIDSALQILARPSMMSPEGGVAAAAHDHGTPPPVEKIPPDTVKPVKAPLEFRKQIGSLLDAYMPVSAALTADNANLAVTKLPPLEAALEAVDMHILSGQAHQIWMPMWSALKDSLDQMKAAKDLTGIRNYFLPFSTRLIDTVKTFGFHPPGPVYQIRCPMAFAGKGGSWLQTDRVVRNPYYGKMMPGCGEVVCSFPAEPED